MVPTGMLPAYLAEAFGELYSEDGLIVLGRGLGCLSLLASFVRFYADTEEGHVAVQEEAAEEEEKKRRAKRRKRKSSEILPDEPQPQQKASSTAKEITKRAPRKPPLVLVLGLRDADRVALTSVLENWGTPPSMLPTMITNESGQSKDRAHLYKAGGVLCITSQILIVDLLTGTLMSDDVAGILVGRAEQVTERSTEAFILRIYQSQKRPAGSGFVKAFTDAPERVVAGFAKVDKILKALHVRRLYLYPRFRDSIRSELEDGAAPIVTELHQPLSPLQREMQNAIAAAVKGCMRELRQSTTLLEWTDAELSVENCVTEDFDRAVSRQLEHDWHRLKPQTKQLVNDLRTLRTLFRHLAASDCVTFWKFINNVKTVSAASRHPSMWLLSPAADMLFRKAKERVYRIRRPQRIGQSARLEPVLEENPKWRLLRQVLEEIRQEHQKRAASKEGNGPSASPVALVMVQDDRTVESVRSYLAEGRKRTLTHRWWRFLENYNDRSRSVVRGKGGGSSALAEESRLLLEEEGRCRRLLFGRHSNGSKEKEKTTAATTKRTSKAKGQNKEKEKSDKSKKQLNEVPSYLRKRRRIAAERGRGALTTGDAEDLERCAVLDEAIERTEHDLEEERSRRSGDNLNEEDNNEAVDLLDEDSGDDSVRATGADEGGEAVAAAAAATPSRDEDGDDDDRMFHVSHPNDELRVVIRSYSSVEGDQATVLLHDLQPRYVVLFDTDISFVRLVEIYASLRHAALGRDVSDGDRLRVYFLLFEASAEEKNFMKSLEREKNAFERLIHHKKTMPPPALHQGLVDTQEMQHAFVQGSGRGVAGTYAGGSLPLAVDTRRGRGKAEPSGAPRDVAVDVREFRSALPFILHQGGMRLAPVTLIVGDFVLSNVHCVERKSISDLYGSFASGRLHAQAEAMCRHYECPCLLIEFNPERSFRLQNANDLGVEIRHDSICSKMALLAMHFPKLRILWSRGPHETLRIFRDLKVNHGEVDVDRAMEIGRNESVDAALLPMAPANDNKSDKRIGQDEEEEEEEEEINEVARDMLLRLPGVTVQSARKIMQECDSLLELSGLSREELRRMAGPITGQKLFTFFRQKMAAT